ncbi:DUF5957 family protein [Micromonospora sp. NPDC007230]|uniref:DUF5957 family protein n=1 Tax=Micromonospora sp. NPDC007230 TaxID=3364237 RepID=UPI0036B3DD14
MKILVWVLLGAAAGLIFGVLLSEFIAVAGMLVAREPVGVKFLPLYLAVAFAAIAALVATVRGRGR